MRAVLFGRLSAFRDGKRSRGLNHPAPGLWYYARQGEFSHDYDYHSFFCFGLLDRFCSWLAGG